MADAPFELILRRGICVTPAGRIDADIGLRGGRIAAIGDLAMADCLQEMDCTGLHVLPGVIDSQVHFREPGMTHKEDLESGTRAAALGGTTAIFEMPNTKPPTTDQAALDDKLARAAGRSWCDYAFFVGATPDNPSLLQLLEKRPGCDGVKMFMGASTGDLLVDKDRDVAHVLGHGRRRMPVHCEDNTRLTQRKKQLYDELTVERHPEWRDEEAARLATVRLLKLAREARRRVQVLHVTTAEEMAILADNKDLATVEVTPQHLTLEAPEAYQMQGKRVQMNPPIRDAHHRQALWQAVADGIVDVLGSDHAPHTAQEKDQATYPDSPAGMPGVQTLVPLMLDHVNAGKLSLERFVDIAAAGPARAYNIAGKGRIAVGYDGDLTVVDLNKHATIRNADMAYKGGWTPFDGRRVHGWPRATVIRGNLVMQEDELLGQPAGQPVRFQESLA